MRLAIISDTHLYTPDRNLAGLYERFLAEADVLIHLGDMVGEEVSAFFQQHPHFYHVRGNCDARMWAENVPITRTMTFEGFNIGAAHGWGPRHLVWQTVARSFGPGYDIILYGHTHMRDCRVLTGSTLFEEGVEIGRDDADILVVNPGSLLAPRDGQAGCAFIQLHEGKMPEVSWVDTGSFLE